ncbi:hypothetical protein [Paenibacillus sp. WC2504]|uniref:hypothetical protein n=1 Tax=Paenibacillus sp. WC2504 TaxID=3461403 RepID=UPI00404610C8
MINKKIEMYKEILFDRPLIGNEYIQDIKYYKNNRTIKTLEQSNNEGKGWCLDRKVISFGEYLSAYISEKNITITQFADQLLLNTNQLIQILDDEILPWEIDINIHKRIRDLCNFDKLNIMEIIENQSLDYCYIMNRTQNTPLFGLRERERDLKEEETIELLFAEIIESNIESTERRKKKFLYEFKAL